jgi:hypothetical protein
MKNGYYIQILKHLAETGPNHEIELLAYLKDELKLESIQATNFLFRMQENEQKQQSLKPATTPQKNLKLDSIKP